MFYKKLTKTLTTESLTNSLTATGLESLLTTSQLHLLNGLLTLPEQVKSLTASLALQVKMKITLVTY